MIFEQDDAFHARCIDLLTHVCQCTDTTFDVTSPRNTLLLESSLEYQLQIGGFIFVATEVVTSVYTRDCLADSATAGTRPVQNRPYSVLGPLHEQAENPMEQ